MQSLRRLLVFMRPYRVAATLSLIALAGAVIALRSGQLIDAGIAPGDTFGIALKSAFLVAGGIATAGVIPSLVRGREARRAPR